MAAGAIVLGHHGGHVDKLAAVAPAIDVAYVVCFWKFLKKFKFGKRLEVQVLKKGSESCYSGSKWVSRRK